VCGVCVCVVCVCVCGVCVCGVWGGCVCVVGVRGVCVGCVCGVCGVCVCVWFVWCVCVCVVCACNIGWNLWFQEKNGSDNTGRTNSTPYTNTVISCHCTSPVNMVYLLL